MATYQFTARAGRETLQITVESDSRLRKYARWVLRENHVSIRVPPQMTQKQIQEIVEEITPKIARQRKRARRQTDIDLMSRATEINKQYFNGELSWHSIRWVNNMERRLGSFTTGGTTDGDIRISERIRNWPSYVVDYVLAHEICHRRHADHGEEFWALLSRYPYTQKALGFIEGVAFAEGVAPDAMMD